MEEITRIDILSFIVAVLGLLTTILIGWQIYQIVCVDKIVKRKTDELEVKIKEETARWNLKSLSYAVSNSYYTKCYDNAIMLLSFVPEHIEYGRLQNDAIVINEQIRNINKVLDEIDSEGFKLSEESFEMFVKAFSKLELFDCVVNRIKSVHKVDGV